MQSSGPIDRDGNKPGAALNLGPPLAATLAARGIATLRYDRRGVGATPGDWRAAGFVDNRRDAAAALHTLNAHPDISAVALIGHGEGAVHAMALAPRAHAAVLLAGYARQGEDVLRRQGRSVTRGLPVPGFLLRALGTAALNRLKATDTDVARLAGIPVNARWQREFLVHDSREDLARIHVPVLAVTGDNDLRVDPADLEVIRRLVPGHVETARIPRLTHLLRIDNEHHTRRSYRRLLREPVDVRLLDMIADWLHHAWFREGRSAPAERVFRPRISTAKA
ncbi:alpha/beta fold hydrolase [Streptomyces sp. NPDC005423]|uniref:alpha/beta hydrolase n=1 Tax=Streptomyces sp. NPDC005423 TaxID=3155343 RepID=UPI0033AF339F